MFTPNGRVCRISKSKEAHAIPLDQNSLAMIDLMLNNLSGKVGALEGVWNSVKSFFVGSGDGILNDTDDSALGSDIITDSNVDVSGFKDGLLTRIINFFKGE